MSKRDLKLNVEVTRNYGLHSVKFGLSEIVSISNGQQRRDAFANLLVQLDDQISLYESVHLQETRLPNVVDSASNGTANNLEQFKPTTLMIESKGGKRIVSIKGGKYSKFGVPVYPECVTDLPIDSYDYGAHDLTQHDLTATVDIVDGKAKRTVSIK